MALIDIVPRADWGAPERLMGNLFVNVANGVLDVFSDAVANPALTAGARMDGWAIYEAAP